MDLAASRLRTWLYPPEGHFLKNGARLNRSMQHCRQLFSRLASDHFLNDDDLFLYKA